MTSMSPEAPDAALAAHADCVAAELAAQDAAWDGGFTRRRFLSGLGLVGVAALGSQLVTTKAAFGATPGGNTLINIFLRGAADGLRMLIPASSALGSDYLASVRPTLMPGPKAMLPLSGSGGWALNENLAALMPYWHSGELTFVPAVSRPQIPPSHFEAQSYLDSGGLPGGSTGWMDRLTSRLGPGTTFRAIGDGGVLPASLMGTEKKLVLNSLAGFNYPCAPGKERRTAVAIESLYRGLHGSLPAAVTETVNALATVAPLRHAKPGHGARYPGGNFGGALSDVATLLRREVGVEVAAIDVGGWDTHTREAASLDQQLLGLGQGLAAFMQDLGRIRRQRVTVVVTTEFGRRVAENGGAGTDHGHGGVMMILGGGIKGQQVAGRWAPLSDATLNNGNVDGLNDPFQVYAELIKKRLHIGSLATIFPGLNYSPVGI